MKPATEAGIDGMRGLLRGPEGLGPNLFSNAIDEPERAAQVLGRQIEDEVGHAKSLVAANILDYFGCGAPEEQPVAGPRFGPLASQLERDPEAQSDALGIPARLPRPAVHDRGLLGVFRLVEHGGRTHPDGMPAVGQLAGAPERRVGVAAGPDGDAVLLSRLRQRAHGRQAIVGAVEL